MITKKVEKQILRIVSNNQVMIGGNRYRVISDRCNGKIIKLSIGLHGGFVGQIVNDDGSLDKKTFDLELITKNDKLI